MSSTVGAGGVVEAPLITVSSDGFRHALWRRVSLLFVRGHVSVGDIDAMHKGVKDYLGTRPGRLATLSVLSPFKARLDSDVRARMKELFDEFEHLHIAEAHVVPADGFVGALQLSLITALFALRKNPVPYRTFKDVQQAAMWLSDQVRELDPGCSALQLASVVQQVGWPRERPMSDKLSGKAGA